MAAGTSDEAGGGETTSQSESPGSAEKSKSDRAFRTISEAAEAIGVPQHVLRFWETRFSQLQPLKRGGNRRYYRPADMALLATIRAMLHDEGLTIRGAQLALGGGKERVKAAPVRVVDATAAVAVHPAPLAVDLPPPVATFTPAPGPLLDLAALRDIRDRLRHALAA